MEDPPVVYGLTFKISPENYDYPELRSMLEKQGRDAFRATYSAEPEAEAWHYQEATVWGDLETGEQIPVEPMWMFTVEGTK